VRPLHVIVISLITVTVWNITNAILRHTLFRPRAETSIPLNTDWSPRGAVTNLVVTVPDYVELGLRADGVVVWRMQPPIRHSMTVTNITAQITVTNTSSTNPLQRDLAQRLDDLIANHEAEIKSSFLKGVEGGYYARGAGLDLTNTLRMIKDVFESSRGE
jgi:hypothetical protein